MYPDPGSKFKVFDPDPQSDLEARITAIRTVRYGTYLRPDFRGDDLVRIRISAAGVGDTEPENSFTTSTRLNIK